MATTVRILIFISDRSLIELSKRRIWYADGTFKSAPKGFMQLYTIHGINENGLAFPAAYILTQDRTADT